MKNNKRKIFIYIRYFAPIALAVAALALMLVPCYTYVMPDKSVNEAVSLGELIANSWNTSRTYAFGGGEKNDVTMGFVYTIMALTCTLTLLFALGALSAVYALVRFLRRNRGTEAQKIFFITAVPNRIVLCIYHALMLPVFILPTVMPLLYDRLLMYSVALSVSPFDMIFAMLALYAATVALIAMSAPYERIEEMDVFARHEIARGDEDDSADEPEGESESDVAAPDDPYERMKKEAVDEQTERILRMLKINHENDEEERK